MRCTHRQMGEWTVALSTSRIGAIAIQRTRRQQKDLVVLRAMYAAKPGKEKKAARRALKAFKKANPRKADLRAA